MLPSYPGKLGHHSGRRPQREGETRPSFGSGGVSAVGLGWQKGECPLGGCWGLLLVRAKVIPWCGEGGAAAQR